MLGKSRECITVAVYFSYTLECCCIENHLQISGQNGQIPFKSSAFGRVQVFLA